MLATQRRTRRKFNIVIDLLFMFELILSNVGITPQEMLFTGMLVYYARMSVNR